MAFTVRENPQAVWTAEALEHVEKYKNEYGSYPPDKIAEERKRIEAGNPTLRGKGLRVFELLNDGIHVGDVVVSLNFLHEWEVDTAVWDRYQRHGFATRGLREVVGRLVPAECHEIVGVIRPQNEGSEKVRSLLRKVGFTNRGSDDQGYDIWVYSLSV